ncbi:MAG: TetR/AcrR family transcriptional regulator [Myxococcota bacterium]
MPRPRFEKLDAKKREAILDSAEEEFAAKGFAQASYNLIIERAGVSKGAMYYYFDDKADLYSTVIGHRFGDLVNAVGDVGEVNTPEEFWAGCNAMVGRAMVYIAADPEQGERMRGLVRSLAEAPPGAREVLAMAREPTRQLLETGQDVGAVRSDLPVDLLAAMVLALGEAMDTWLAENWASLPPEGLAPLEGELMGVFRRLCDP